MRNRASGWLLILITLLAVAFWWLLIDNERSGASAKPVHIADLRVLATSIPGAHPTGVSYVVLATRRSPGDYWVAGLGLKRRTLTIVAWSLPMPGHGPIVIDPGLPPAAASVGTFANFDRTRQSQVDAASRVAGLVLNTEGKMVVPGRAVGLPLPKVPANGKARPNPASPTRGTPAAFAQAVAPGVVVIPAPGHAPDARLIFVQLADGREFLFTGDIATFTENWARLRLRSRLAAAWGPAQDRAETLSWLRTIRQLRDEAPNMKIVPGHDYTWLSRQRSLGAIAEWPLGARTAPDKK